MAATTSSTIREEDFVAKVKDYTNGKGVDVVYDSIGKDTFPGSLDCLKPLGMWVSFGQSSGPVPEFKITLLSQKGSLFATRPSIIDYTRSRKDLVATANDLFDVVAQGQGQGRRQPDLSSGRGGPSAARSRSDGSPPARRCF